MEPVHHPAHHAPRDNTQITTFFDDLELAAPGVVSCPQLDRRQEHRAPAEPRPPVAQHGYAIRVFRHLCGWARVCLAASAGISAGVRCSIEHERSSASTGILDRFALGLGAPVTAITWSYPARLDDTGKTE